MFFPQPMHPMMPHMYMQMNDSQLTNQQPSFTNRPPPPAHNFTVKVIMQMRSFCGTLFKFLVEIG